MNPNSDNVPAEGRSESPIHALVKQMNRHLAEVWTTIWNEQEEALTEMFANYGDRAYGAFVQRLMEPIAQRLQSAGYAIRAGFNRHDSVENWGPPEERERCCWYVVRDADGVAAGTAVLQLFHSHVSFRLPQAPNFLALEETEPSAIAAALSYAAVRLTGQGVSYRNFGAEPAQAWEYGTDAGLGDYLNVPAGQRQTGTGYIDHALALWGRNGWELVTVMPHGDRLVGYFKRPAR
ncbi:DUF6022 family protein [Cohnella nanjingensis]|uniref:Uncharacterized protein n=1 Tax=Cohnella nanjingensis TaxID=1387779 RepID=A0A7X0RR10_9BACL|nr:DUF6022 family protein [Cohnella nanjingensis]MBB6672078.1 hypothetical protein [Cohnella nanjingensis]